MTKPSPTTVLAALVELVDLENARKEAASLLYYGTDTEGNVNRYPSVQRKDQERYDYLMNKFITRSEAIWADARAVVEAAQS